MAYKRKPWYIRFIKNIKRTVQSSVLCIRFPFLYPRNRFSDLHYNSYKLNNYVIDLRKKSAKIEFSTPDKENEPDKVIKTTTVLNWPLYIWYRIVEFTYFCILQWIHVLPNFTELDAMPDGWRKAFGIQMCKEIRAALIYEYGLKGLFTYRIMQIKEKFGELRWYDGNSSRRIFDIIDKYEDISRKTCISCGKPATWMSTGWISPYCDDCIGDTDKKAPIKQQNNC